MKKYIKIALLVSVISSCQNLTQQKFNFDEANELEKVSYSIGINVATSIKSEGLDSINSFYISKGFQDVFENKDLAINIEESNKIIGEYFNKKQDAKNQRLAIDSKKEPLSSSKICGSNIDKPSILVFVIFIFRTCKDKN